MAPRTLILIITGRARLIGLGRPQPGATGFIYNPWAMAQGLIIVGRDGRGKTDRQTEPDNQTDRQTD